MAAKSASKTRKQTSKKKGTWGGARAGAGRKKGSGQGASPDARVSRVSVMLSRREHEKLARAAKRERVPLATLAYELIAEGLTRRTR